MKKITHIIISLDVGGAELMLKRLLESHQGNLNYRHSVISLKHLGKVGMVLKDMGVEVCVLDMRTLFDIPRVLWQLTRIIRSERPDVVQTWMYHADLLGGLAARLAGNHRVIWGIRNTYIRSGHLTLLVRKICGWFSNWLPHTIICVAEASRLAHIALGYEPSRMVVISNGLDTSRLVATSEQRDTLRKQCSFDDNDIVIGSLGRFHPNKDHANFVRAAGLLAQQFSAVRFLLVGRNLDENNTQLTAWIKATGYEDRFVLLGERSDVSICLAAFDVYCLHSLTEGFPNSTGEAMAMGLPCVATDVGDAALLLADTGVVVPKADTTALAHGLKQIVEMTPEARLILGKKAKERIYSEFTMDRCRERFETVYKQVLTEARG